MIVSVRYEPDGLRIALARGYERRGYVWSDLMLYDRQALLGRLEAGERIMTGKDALLAGDFEVLTPVRLRATGAAEPDIVANGMVIGKDDLRVPLF